MLIYLIISIITSILMNWFNKRVALVPSDEGRS